MFLKALTAAVGMLALAGFAQPANAVPFSVTAASFTTGSGYGTGAGQLDVTFTTAGIFTPQVFDLGLGDIKSFLFGRVNLSETCIGDGGLFTCGFLVDTADETNNLGVTANLTFASPLASTVQSVAVTGAFGGTVNGDGATDYFIDFSPVTVNFGTGGAFKLDIADMLFNQTGPISPGANITLTALPVAVPEPVSIALLGVGLVGLGGALRRRRA